MAAVADHSPVVALLIDAAPTSTCRETKGSALVPTAASARHPNRASRVLGRSTALIAAAFEGHTLVVEQLIAAGAALDVQESNG